MNLMGEQTGQTPRVIGRSSALARLHDTRTSDSDQRVALVVGPAGIGKTTLLQAFRSEALADGCAVGWGVAGEWEGTPSLWPWFEALRDIDPNQTILSAGLRSSPTPPDMAEMFRSIAIWAERARFKKRSRDHDRRPSRGRANRRRPFLLSLTPTPRSPVSPSLLRHDRAIKTLTHSDAFASPSAACPIIKSLNWLTILAPSSVPLMQPSWLNGPMAIRSLCSDCWSTTPASPMDPSPLMSPSFSAAD